MGLRRLQGNRINVQIRKGSETSQISTSQEIKNSQSIQREVPKKKWRYNPNFISHKQQEKNIAKIIENAVDIPGLPEEPCPLQEELDKLPPDVIRIKEPPPITPKQALEEIRSVKPIVKQEVQFYRRISISKELENQVLDLRDQGIKRRVIAKRLNIHTSRVSYIIEKDNKRKRNP